MTGTLVEGPDTRELTYPMSRGHCPLDPPAALQDLRETEPITLVRIWDGSTPWLITRHEDARAVLADQRFSVDFRKDGYPSTSPGQKARRKRVRSFISMDDPEHARYRKMLISEFTMKRTQGLRPMITEVVEHLLDAMEAGPRPVDLVQAFTLPLPSMVICRILGVPYSDHEFFQRISAKLLDNTTAPEDALVATDELSDYLLELVHTKDAEPGDDLTSRLAVNRLRTGEITADEVVAMLNLLLIAGHETTANQLALGALTLLRHPDQAAEIRSAEDPALVNGAVEELLRLLTVVHSGRRRVATEDVEIGGVTIRRGDGVIVAGEIANRDPAVFENPDDLDIHRSARHHVAFGFGVHQCLGQPLARVELQIAYPALLRRFPDLAVTEKVEDLPFRDEMIVYGLHELPVTW